MYPSSDQLNANNSRANAGTLEIVPMETPLALFVWSKTRIVPVRLTDFSITEEAFDPLLNPLRAKVDLTLNVLSDQGLKLTHPGHALFMAHQIAKEIMATANIANTVQNIGAGLKLR